MEIKSFEEFMQEAVNTVSLADTEKEMDKKDKSKEARGKKDPFPLKGGKKKFDAKQAFADAGVDLTR